MRPLHVLFTAVAMTLSATCGCEKDKPTTEHKPREKPVFHLDGSTDQAAPPVAENTPALPPGHPPIGATQPAGGLPPGHPTIDADGEEGGELTFTAPAGWISQPARPMTEMVFKLPTDEGGPGDADLAVSTLGTKVVTLAMNVERWCGQFELPAGKTCADFSQPTPVEGTRHPTVLVEMNGAYKSGSMAGGSAGPAKPDYRMLTAVITAPSGQWFIKLVGPDKTVERWRASFMDFIRQAQ